MPGRHLKRMIINMLLMSVVSEAVPSSSQPALRGDNPE